MPRYLCLVTNIDGELQRQELQAESKEKAEDYWADKGYLVNKVKEIAEDEFRLGRRGVKIQEIISFTVQLRSVYMSGIPLEKGICDIAAETKDKRMKEVLQDVQRRLEQGSNISNAMANHPQVFDEVYINIIRVGEAKGSLNEVLEQLVQMLVWRNELREQIISASIYPIIMLVAVVGVLVFVVTFLVPRFVVMFETLGIDKLPRITQFFISTYTLFSTHIEIVIGGVIALIVLFIWMKKSRAGRYAFDRVILSIPVIGGIAWRIALSRFAQTLSLMWRTGVDPSTSLKIVKGVVGNSVLARHLAKAHERVVNGESLSKSLEDVKGLPPLIIRMISTGEQTGQLSETLYHVAEFYNRELPFILKRMLALVQPIITALFAAVVLALAMAILSPIFSVWQSGLGQGR
ncbi:MAG: type II secretion system F family protein [Desulfobacterales bacterium]|nr:type II secretion system F family protein [Desulfobacterales bacterium]